jgi:hypothetical protein
MEANVKLYSLNYSETRTYFVAFIFILGNIALPQLCHLIPQGGLMWLPIYFFTLIGAYKFGIKVGFLTAVLSPILNSVLFGMPLPSILPAILVKSILLAAAGGFASQHYKRISISVLASVVIFYQLVGTLIEWALVNNFFLALQDIRIGIPGILLQIFGSYFFIKYIIRK